MKYPYTETRLSVERNATTWEKFQEAKPKNDNSKIQHDSIYTKF